MSADEVEYGCDDLEPPTLLTGEDGELFAEANAWVKAGNPFKADQFLNRIQECLWNEPDFVLLRCKIYKRTKKWDLLFETAERLVKIIPDDSHAWLYLVEAARKCQSCEAKNALDPILNGLQAQPKLHSLALCYSFKCGHFEEPKRLILRAIQGDPDRAKQALCHQRMRPLLREIQRFYR